ncbi:MULTISPECIES: GNAT family N-acetyltransferase [Chitinophaga]|uniref:GNAT family N-acetyltransferase n=1 Tax=Chitinophaga TaxID=79328 RepID=UPI00115A6A80|nr:GNAT family protein [Chitinophaga polysaccharea]
MIIGSKTGLRAVEREDLVLLRDWRNIPSFRRNFREHRELSMFNQEGWYNRTMSSQNDYMFIIESLVDSAPIGACGLLYISWITRSADFSFYIGDGEKYIDNEGLAKDAAQLLIDYGFKNLNLNKIWMELYEFDEKKIKFFTEEFGFKKDGILRENCYEDGRYYNSFIISLLRNEYLNG